MMKRISARPIILGILVLAVPLLVLSARTAGQDPATSDNVVRDQWEYLVVSGASRTNFTPTGNPRMRKEVQGTFASESFVLEQHLDKLGANGWELISVSGAQADPTFYFKRRK